MKVWHIFLFFGTFLISYSAEAGNLSANPWLKKNSTEAVNTQIQTETPNYPENSAVFEGTSANPWMQNNKENSIAAAGSQLKQNLKSAAENSQKSLQNLSDQAHRLAAFSSATSQNRDEGVLTNFAGELSELMRDKQQAQPDNNANSYNFGSFPDFNAGNGRKRYNNIRQETFSLEAEASQAYHQTTDKVKRNIKSKYNSMQRKIAPYTSSARNAMQSWEDKSGSAMEQIQKIMH